MRPESNHFTPTAEYPHPELWTARDSEASEIEVGDFLYGLVRLMKPGVVIETGCYLSDTTDRIVAALTINNHGHLHTCDVKERFIQESGPRVTYYLSKGVDLCKQVGDVDLAFIDSNGDRVEEMQALQIRPNGCVVLHDSRWQALDPIRQMGWTEIFFPTPRGISLFKVNNAKT